MNQVILISVVIPAFNASKTIKSCVDSIFINLNEDQRQQIEVIIVDDGSKDGTFEIARNLSKNNENIKVVRKENGGVSSARNVGIQKSTGLWIAFVDADDRLANGAVSILIDNIQKSKFDLLIYSILSEFKGGGSDKIEIQNYKNYVKTFIVDIPNIRGGAALYCSVCNKLYLKSIIDGNKISFDERLDFGEDFCFNMTYLRNSNYVKCIDTVLYLYDQSIVESGVKRYRYTFAMMIEEMAKQMHHTLDHFQIKGISTINYFNRFLAGNYTYILDILIETNKSVAEKSDIVGEWLNRGDKTLLNVASELNCDSGSIIKSFIMKQDIKKKLRSIIVKHRFIKLRKKIRSFLLPANR